MYNFKRVEGESTYIMYPYPEILEREDNSQIDVKFIPENIFVELKRNGMHFNHLKESNFIEYKEGGLNYMVIVGDNYKNWEELMDRIHYAIEDDKQNSIRGIIMQYTHKGKHDMNTMMHELKPLPIFDQEELLWVYENEEQFYDQEKKYRDLLESFKALNNYSETLEWLRNDGARRVGTEVAYAVLKSTDLQNDKQVLLAIEAMFNVRHGHLFEDLGEPLNQYRDILINPEEWNYWEECCGHIPVNKSAFIMFRGLIMNMDKIDIRDYNLMTLGRDLDWIFNAHLYGAILNDWSQYYVTVNLSEDGSKLIAEADSEYHYYFIADLPLDPLVDLKRYFEVNYVTQSMKDKYDY